MVSPNKKGSGGEREFCEYLKFNFDIDAKRELGQAREGGCDIKKFPFCIEVKRCQVLDLRGWWTQCTKACRNLNESEPQSEYQEWISIVAFRQNNKEWEFLLSAKWIGLEKGFIRLMNNEFKKWMRFYVDHLAHVESGNMRMEIHKNLNLEDFSKCPPKHNPFGGFAE